MTQEETGKHLDYLDGWRGSAVLLVLAGHFWGDEQVWSGMSTFGVELFFVLSGRLMAEILFLKQSSLPRFFIRRFSRIYPALLAYVAVVSLIFAATTYRHGYAAAALALTFTINYAMVYAHPVALLDHLWSLCVEEHTYIVLAGVALLVRRKASSPTWIVASLASAAFVDGAIRTYVLHSSYFDVHWRSEVSASFILTAAAIWPSLKGTGVSRWLSPATLLASLAAASATSGYLSNTALCGILLGVSVCTVDQGPSVFKRVLSHPAARQMGLWSYSLYLWQQPFYKLHRDDAVSVYVGLAAVFGCALISHYVIERPARNWLNQWFDRKMAASQNHNILPAQK